MKIKKFLNNSNNNLLNSFCLESGTNVFKDHVPITTLKENNKKKVFYSYNIIDGYKYKIIVKRKKNNLNNTKFIISSLDHPYIVKLIHCCEYSSCYISVFEFFSDITLYSSVIFSTKYDERKIKNIIYQIFLTVNYLHSNNLFHKNLAPYSFLIKIVNNEVMIKLEDVYNIKALSTKLNSKMKSENIYSIGVISNNKKKKEKKKKEDTDKIYRNDLFYVHENISHKGQSFLRRILLSDLSIYDFWKKNTFKRYILNNISKFMVKEDIYKYNFLFFYFDLLEEGSIKYEQYSSTMKKLGLIDANVQESFNGLDVSERGQIQFSNIIACLLNNFIKIDKKVVFKFFKKVDYNNEGIITKKKLYKFYNITTKSDLSVNDKRKFNFEDFYSYISKE
ncbi:protein kinase, putative [Plasmodium malariae]|uniref:Protein kinase, putative n=1 Tax=Plasmodium malariae TaxID=5858 RepID=A0A1A8W3T7_PLAMA|nr:protein kinase, putative [Plasmodium malariae]